MGEWKRHEPAKAEPKEFWANFYPGRYGLEHYARRGEKCFSRDEAAQALAPGLKAFRIHVRLKPEGAPKLYASESERYSWEHIRNAGPTAAQAAQSAEMEAAWGRASQHLYDTDPVLDGRRAPRTPKIEERT